MVFLHLRWVLERLPGAFWGVFAPEVGLKGVVRCVLGCFCTWGGSKRGCQVHFGAILHLRWVLERVPGAFWGVFAPEVGLGEVFECKMRRFCTWGEW